MAVVPFTVGKQKRAEKVRRKSNVGRVTVRWVSPDEAKSMIHNGRNYSGSKEQ